MAKRKMTDFSIDAIMAEEQQKSKKVATLDRKSRSSPLIKCESPSETRKSLTPSSTSEFPDTTTSDDLIPPPQPEDDKCLPPELAKVDCHLETKELWQKFDELGTEMIITRSGRRMFPTLRSSFTGLAEEGTYLLFLDIVSVDSKRYRYAYHRSSWLVAGKGDPPHHTKLYLHPDSPFTPQQLRKQIISFEKVKLTNTEVNKPGYIVLNSMHRYQPRIHLVYVEKSCEIPVKSLKTLSDLENHDYRTFSFPECAFYSVTAYQNQLITKMKIDCNPFAKGFRDSTRVFTDMERERECSMHEQYQSQLGSIQSFQFNKMDSPLKLPPYPSMLSLPCLTPEGLPLYGTSLYGAPSIPLQFLQQWSARSGLPIPDQRMLSNDSVLDLSKHLSQQQAAYAAYCTRQLFQSTVNENLHMEQARQNDLAVQNTSKRKC